MGVTFTRAEIRRLVGQEIRDENGGLHSAAKVNRMIAKVHRDMVERSECNLNVLVFSLASATANGVIEYDKNSNGPSITRIDVEGRNYYQIENCDLIDRISIWDDTYGGWKELAPKSQFEIDNEGLLYSDDIRPCGYQQLSDPAIFQFLPELASSGYTYKFEVRYREAIRDMITYDGSPTDSTVIQTTGAGLSDFTVSVTNASMPAKYRLTITTAGTPDGVDIDKDIYDGNGWVSVSEDVGLTGSAQTIADNVTFTAGATTGHTLNDVFEFAVDDLLTPSCPQRFRHIITNGVCGELLRQERDQEYQTYMAQYENDLQRVKRKARRLNSDQAFRFRNDYRGAGG